MPIKKVRMVWDTWLCDDCRLGKKVEKFVFVIPKFKYIDLDGTNKKTKKTKKVKKRGSSKVKRN